MASQPATAAFHLQPAGARYKNTLRTTTASMGRPTRMTDNHTYRTRRFDVNADSVLTEREVLEEELEIVRAQRDAALDALERTERNLLLSIRSRPVRDLCENLAENAAALHGSGRGVS